MTLIGSTNKTKITGGFHVNSVMSMQSTYFKCPLVNIQTAGLSHLKWRREGQWQWAPRRHQGHFRVSWAAVAWWLCCKHGAWRISVQSEWIWCLLTAHGTKLRELYFICIQWSCAPCLVSPPHAVNLAKLKPVDNCASSTASGKWLFRKGWGGGLRVD